MIEKILELENINKAFDEKKVHRGISFSLNKGESLGLLGASGTGKSVLLRSIIGLEFIDEGKISYKGKRIDDYTEREFSDLRTRISYSFQSGALFDSMTVHDNLAFPLKEHSAFTNEQIDGEVNKILKLIDLEGINKLMPSDLSGGMQKRVGMARSMILHPDIILYDEPTAGLDPANTINVINLMKTFRNKGVSSIFVTHDIPAAKEFCSRIIILDAGKIVFEGSVEEFSTSDSPIVKKFLINEGLKDASTSA